MIHADKDTMFWMYTGAYRTNKSRSYYLPYSNGHLLGEVFATMFFGDQTNKSFVKTCL